MSEIRQGQGVLWYNHQLLLFVAILQAIRLSQPIASLHAGIGDRYFVQVIAIWQERFGLSILHSSQHMNGHVFAVYTLWCDVLVLYCP